MSNASVFQSQSILQLHDFVESANTYSVSDMYSNNYRWLVNLLNKKLRCSHVAADLAQDTFISILSKDALQPIDKIHNPRAYLTTIAQRILFNFYKRRSLEQAYLEAISHMPDDMILSVEDRLILLETLQQIDAMLDGLQVQIRRAFLLSQLEGLTYAEIALKLKISQRTVKRYMTQAFEQCLTLMD